MSSSDLACVYAALILHDDNVDITAEKISTLLSAAKVNVEPYWPDIFAKALNGVDVKSLLCNVGVGSGTPAGGSSKAAENVKEAEEAKEVVKEESEEESDDNMGFGLFD